MKRERRGRAAALALVGAVAAGCAYYNGMWSAERYAAQARRAEARGEDNEAKGLWFQAAVKAESVLARHPRSRWADDALVLRGEALVRVGNCAAAESSLVRARAIAGDGPIRDRAELAAAQCALEGDRPGVASELLAGPLASDHDEIRSRAAWLAGRAAMARGDAGAAVEHYARSTLPAAGPARLRALLAAGRTGAALALVDSLAGRRLTEPDWQALFADLAKSAEPGDASDALNRFLARTRLPLPARQRLLLADGDRLLAAGARDAAVARYSAVAAADAEGTEGSIARVRLLFAAAARAESVAALEPIRATARRYVVAAPASILGTEAQELLGLLDRIATSGAMDADAFRSAELARDSLRAPALAGSLFLAFARAHPTSLFAPKALVAALPLVALDGRSDSILTVLEETYGGSPYTLALRGEASPAYAAAEDSLAQDLGLERETAAAAFYRGIAPPVPGMRGPWLETILPTLGGAGTAEGGTERRNGVREAPPNRRRPGDRP